MKDLKKFAQFSPFFPLIIAFGLIAVVIDDLKHLRVERYTCQVLAVGRSATPYRKAGTVLYSNDAPEPYNIAFSCPILGTVFINDYTVTQRGIVKGDKTRITHKLYRRLPDTWSIQVQNHYAT